MKKTLLAALIAGLGVGMSAAAHAFDPFVVRDIRVEGIQRTEAGTVFSYLPIKVGEKFDDERAAQSIKALFATGFFKDVRLEIEGDVLVVVLDERPAISQIDFTGLKEFDKDQLKKGLRDVGLAESRIFDRALLEKAEQELKRQYLTRGKYAVDIKTTVTPLERNRVGINFAVNEGDAAKIRQISIVGAHAFPEKELTELFQLRTPNWLTWYTKNDQYSKQKLAADIESLKSHYLNRGYLEFNVDSTDVSITPDKNDIYITLSVTEGERYVVSSVKLAGDLVLSEEELRALVKIKPGDVFSREKLNETNKAISDKLGNLGYAFANVNAAPEVDKEKRQVAFTIFVDPGRRVYVRRLNVTGNTRTQDAVVRREMRQMESAWYDAEKIRLSRERIDKLGHFSEVTVETPAVPGTSDQVDLNVNVTERPTGSIMVGAGFSSAEKLILSAGISQNNLFGSGKAMTLQINSGKINQVYSLSFTDPYFTKDGVSRSYDLYKRVVNPLSLYVAHYTSSSLGAGIRFGVPVTEKDRVSAGLAVDETTITTYADSPQRYLDHVKIFGPTTQSLVGSAGWVRDGTDSFIYPTKGAIQRFSTDVGLPGLDFEYYRLTYQHQRYFPLSKTYTLMLNGEFGYANGLGGKPLPFFKNFYAGGIGSVRGYMTSSLGQHDVNGYAMGGNRRLTGSAELLFPLPGSGLDKSFRLSVFVDAGQVYAADEKVDLGQLRYSAGLAFAWISPVGPLKFSVANPLNAKIGDRSQRFQFQLGTVF